MMPLTRYTPRTPTHPNQTQQRRRPGGQGRPGQRRDGGRLALHAPPRRPLPRAGAFCVRLVLFFGIGAGSRRGVVVSWVTDPQPCPHPQTHLVTTGPEGRRHVPDREGGQDDRELRPQRRVHPPGLRRALEQGREQVHVPVPRLPVRQDRCVVFFILRLSLMRPFTFARTKQTRLPCRHVSHPSRLIVCCVNH